MEGRFGDRPQAASCRREVLVTLSFLTLQHERSLPSDKRQTGLS